MEKAHGLLCVTVPALQLKVAGRHSAYRCDRSHKHTVLSGIAEDGTFNAAPPKTYPSNLNLLLAEVLHDSVHESVVAKSADSLSTSGGTDAVWNCSIEWDGFISSALAPFYVPLHPFAFSHA